MHPHQGVRTSMSMAKNLYSVVFVGQNKRWAWRTRYLAGRGKNERQEGKCNEHGSTNRSLIDRIPTQQPTRYYTPHKSKTGGVV